MRITVLDGKRRVARRFGAKLRRQTLAPNFGTKKAPTAKS
jgi:hypothetical protein